MPQKGQKAITVNEEVFRTLEGYGQEQGMSVAGVVAWAAGNLKKFQLLQVVEEETLKEALAQACYTLEGTASFIDNNMSPPRGLFGGTKFIDAEYLRELSEIPLEERVKFGELLLEMHALEQSVTAEAVKVARILGRYSPLWRSEVTPIVRNIGPIPVPDHHRVLSHFKGYMTGIFGQDGAFVSLLVEPLQALTMRLPELRNTLNLVILIHEKVSTLMVLIQNCVQQLDL